jgi:hypothetical protein
LELDAALPKTAAPVPPPSPRLHKRVGPYSKHGALALLDGRSREAQFMRTRRAELIAHVGGKPSAVERQLIERAVRLSLQLELMDERLTRGDQIASHATYLAWSNSLARTLRLLGLKPLAHATAPSLADHLARRQAGAAA